MKTSLLLLLVLLTSFKLNAQDYNLVQRGVKRYFTNSQGYLRGMRVDSVTIAGSDTVFHMFRSERGRYIDSSYQAIQMDTAGGSWLGKTVQKDTAGNHFIYTFWGDTVVIKTAATTGDKWRIYDDTSAYWYEAEVTRADTISFFGYTDSMKEITITAMHDTAVNTTDSLNGFTLIIGKKYGILKSCDLYMFPLHEPSLPFKKGFDYYTDKAGDLSFSIANFHHMQTMLANPDTFKKYSLKPGDVFQRKNSFNQIQTDYIIENRDTAYLIFRAKQSSKYQYSSYPTYTTTGNMVCNHGDFMQPMYVYSMMPDTMMMPEEKGNGLLIWYKNGYCIESPLYQVQPTNVAKGLLNTFEPYWEITRYKLDIGRLSTDMNRTTSNFQYSEFLSYIKKDTVKCGNLEPMQTDEIKKIVDTEIFPNPAHDKLYIRLPEQGAYHITLANAMGQTIREKKTQQGTAELHTVDLPAGLYHVSIRDQTGIVTTKKVAIYH